MATQSAAKPRPRPRPAPRPAPAASSSSTPPTSAGTVASEDTAQSSTTDVDLSSIFNRNSAKERAARVQRAQKVMPTVLNLSDDEPVPEPESPGGVKRKRGQRKGGEHVTIKPAPDWTRRAGSAPRGDSTAPDGTIYDSDGDLQALDSDSSFAELDGPSTPRAKQKQKRKATRSPTRHQSRSRSPTPPPALTEFEKQRIAAGVKELFKSSSKLQSAYTSALPENGDANDLGDVDPGSSECVVVVVRWLRHPSDLETSSRPEDTFEYRMDRHKTLRPVFTRVADKKRMAKTEIVLLHRDQRLALATTPISLVEWASRLQLNACDENTYYLMDLVKKQEKVTKISQIKAAESQFDAQAEARATQASSSTSSARRNDGEGADEDDDNQVKKIRATIRASASQTVTVNVKLTTTCGKILAHFIKAQNISSGAASRAKLQFDGEDLDPASAIADIDYDDEEDTILFDVIGL